MSVSIIEMHFTLDRKGGGSNDRFSLVLQELAALCRDSKTACQALGRVSQGATESELKSIVFRRSLYVVKDLKAGDVLTTDNVRAIRPGLGLATKYLKVLVGKAC